MKAVPTATCSTPRRSSDPALTPARTVPVTRPRLQRRPRILVFAYACEPGRGSEPGAGWGLVRALGEFADCVVLVAPEHMPAIQQWKQRHATDEMAFVEVGETWFTPPPRRHRLTRFALYLDWLRRANAVGRTLHAQTNFDLVYHATYSTYWLPTPAVRYGIPSVWGPVGGAVVTPRSLWPLLGWRGVLSEMTDWAGVRLLAAVPSSKRSCRLATVRVVQNEATRQRLPEDLRGATLVLNHALFTQVPDVPPGIRGTHCVFVGALDSRKGARLAIEALSHAGRQVHLDIIGDGPERRSLERLARRIGVADRTHFRGQASREQALSAVRRAAAAVFTGLREEGGLALAEAMLVGTPVIVLAHGGARTIASSTTDPDRVVLVAPDNPRATAMQIGRAMTRFSQSPSARHDPMLDGSAAAQILRTAIEGVCDAAASR